MEDAEQLRTINDICFEKGLILGVALSGSSIQVDAIRKRDDSELDVFDSIIKADDEDLPAFWARVEQYVRDYTPQPPAEE